MARPTRVEGVVHVLQLGRQVVPVIQYLLQPIGNIRSVGCLGQVAGNHNQLAVAGTVFVACKFHGLIFACFVTVAYTENVVRDILLSLTIPIHAQHTEHS